MKNEGFKDFILEVLGEASKIAVRSFGTVSGTTKPEDNNQVLTETDIEIGNQIVAAIKQKYPEYNVIDEEAGVIDNGSAYTWVVDPIDGTSNFANGIPAYGVMIGLLEDSTPIAGGVALPSFGQIYVAAKGSGAFCNGKQIHVTSESNLLKTLVAYGIDGHQENPKITEDETAVLSKVILGIRNLRSTNSAYDFMLVADGRYGAFLNRTSKIWDNVAPQIIIEEAGGIFTDFFGKPIDYTNPLSKVNENFTMCAAPRELHRQLQQIIHSRT
jgi:myo-inositol-1(or 4)-monophosphatase